MSHRLSITILSTFVLLFGAAMAEAQPANQARPDNFVTEKGFKSKVLEAKYRDVDSLARVLRNLTSGFKGSEVTPNSEFKTLTVRDFPENLATIEEALKRLDTPGTPPANIELRMHVLLASNTGTGAAPVPELRDVITQLGQTLNFKNYELSTSIVQRITESERGHIAKGTSRISFTDPAGSKTETDLPYTYELNGVSITSSTEGASTVNIRGFSFISSLPNGSMRTQINTALNIRDGEKVVVGTAAFGDRALIVVLTAKLLT